MKMTTDPHYRALAAKYLRKQARLLAAQLEGVRNAQDVEPVHRARVASRRLRAGLKVFKTCIPSGTYRRWRKHLRRVGRGLGRARDRDVHIQYVSEVLANLRRSALAPGVARLLAHLEHRREASQADVLAAADRLGRSGVLKEMLRTAKRVLAETGEEVAPSRFAVEQMEAHVINRLESLFSYESSLADATRREDHHAMRVAAKRLRYTMEIAKPAYPGRLGEFIETARNLQTMLGEIHDCDVWLDELPEFVKRERRRTVRHYGHVGPFARLAVGLEHLEKVQRERRARVFASLVKYWQQAKRGRVWEKLRATLRWQGPSRRATRRSRTGRRGSQAGGGS